MASQVDIETRQCFARKLLEHQIKPVSVCTMLQARYGYSRASAYRDVHKAQAELNEATDDGPATTEAPLDVESLQGQLVYLLSRKVMEEDVKAVSQCVKALDTVNQWNGMKSTLQASHKTGFCN
jgi:hypothetical protein